MASPRSRFVAAMTRTSTSTLSTAPSGRNWWFSRTRSSLACTGAGISAESGIPTFRGAGGLWRKYRAENLATPEAFARDPRLIWEWYDWRRGLIAAAEPNAGHRALARLVDARHETDEHPAARANDAAQFGDGALGNQCVF